ncbi:hypothetical protein [Streptomyces sp. AM 3-1-1]|uniref:hypothetical protein n=1 Tax=Streptomyces sp. AM 3-1-1 TaxID=3028711 RepID=UPI0023BA09E6|nr:hypothetical protein [Streptomyces sp. AM 3-1-1]WEH30131.1 hypothetical protein P0D76_23975 [Streptomyces sp. AM 3-1-1]
MTATPEIPFILPAEFVGLAKIEDGHLNIGGLKVPWDGGLCDTVPVYVRRLSRDGSVAEIHLARHDGYAQEELDAENARLDQEES